MKKSSIFLSAAFFAAVLFSACTPKECVECKECDLEHVTPPVEKEGGVIINGVCWAKCNVGAFRTFVSKPTDYGMLYQWNRQTAYDNTTTGAVTGWDNTLPEGEVWAKANDPSPDGWRVPTAAEIATLLQKDKVKNEWVEEIDGVFGCRFTDLSTNKSIFLPAAGCRYGSDGALDGVGTFGYYWLNTDPGGDNAYDLHFRGNGVVLSGDGKVNGFSVRPVAE